MVPSGIDRYSQVEHRNGSGTYSTDFPRPDLRGSRLVLRDCDRLDLKIPSTPNVYSNPKSCGQLLGESWPRAIRSGTGRGGDVTGSRVSSCSFLLSAIARAGSGDCRPVVTQGNPNVGIAL